MKETAVYSHRFSPGWFWGLLVMGMLGVWSTGSVFSEPQQIIDGGFCWYPPLQSLITVGGWGPASDWDQLKTVWALKGGKWSPLPEYPVAVTHTAMTFDQSRQL